MRFNDFWINNNGKREQLDDTKHGVRKEQVDKKYHNLFDAYDVNGDGTLEDEELQGIFTGLTKFAGADKTLDANENKQVASLFENQVNIKDADFMGFVKSVSNASQDIVSSETTSTPDGGKEVKTTYKDGTVETISYYPDGEYKFKKLDQESSTTTNFYTIGDNLDKHYTAAEIESRVKKAYNQRVAQIKADAERNKAVESKTTYIIPNYDDFKKDYMQRNRINQGSDTHNFERHDFELSERGKADAQVRDFVLSHYIETHKAAQEALDSMGILDDIGAAINAGAGELWNSIKNKWNGTEEEYQNFYELVKKFEPNYDNSLKMKGTQELAQKHPENYFRGEVGKIDTDNGAKFQQITEQYQNAQILKQRIDILNKAMREIRMFQSEQDALVHAPAQNEGLNPASHILNANNLLLEYFNEDKDAVNMLLNGAIGDSVSTIKAINDIKEETEKLNQSVLGGRSFEDVKKDYQEQYKTTYGTDFVPDELTEKVMDAKATGGMVKLAAITAISVLITKSPIMTQMMGAAAGSAEATGAAVNMIRTLSARYGATAVQQGIKFAMTSGTLATDVGLTLLNQATSERGVDGEELWESTKGSAKYIYFGSFIGAPLAQTVSKQLGKIGAATKMFEGGVKTSTAGIQTTSITGEKLVQNLMKGGNKVLTTGGAFLTDVTAFSTLEVATEGMDPVTAGKEQTEMLGKLKIMNHFIEYMLGGKVHAGMSKAKMDAAIEQSGIKNWNIKEIKTPNKTVYEVEVEEGLPPIRFDDANQLATAMMEKVAGNYKGPVPAENPRAEREVKTKPQKSDVIDTKTALETVEVKTETKEFKLPDDAEFAQLKARVNQKLETLPKAVQNNLTKENILILDKILTDDRLLNNKNLMNNLGNIIYYTYTAEQAKAQYDILDKIFSDDRLASDQNLMDNLGNIIRYTYTAEQAKVKYDILDKISSDDRLASNQNLMDNLRNIIHYTYTAEQTKAQYDILDKIFSDDRLASNKNLMDNLGNIIYSTYTAEQTKAKYDILDKIFSDDRLASNQNLMDNLGNIIRYTNTAEQAKALMSDSRLYEQLFFNNRKGFKFLATISQTELNEYFDTIDAMKEKTKRKPELYINGEETNPASINNMVDCFYAVHSEGLYKLLKTFDKEAVDYLMRKRLDNFGEYLYTLNTMTNEDLELLNKLSNSVNTDSKPFLPTQKAEFIDLLKAYLDSNLSIEKIQSMAEAGKVDIGELNLDLFKQIMRNTCFTEEEIASIPKEKLIGWDVKYIHLLAKDIREEYESAYKDILRAGNLEPDFIKYIHDENNIYGQTNAKTKAQFDELGLDYESWLKPSKENEMQFVSKDKNTEQLTQIAAQITEDMNTLMNSPVKGFLKKQFPKFIKGDEFVIPTEYLASKAKLTELVNLLSDTSENGQLARVWKRAQKNSTNPDDGRAQTARNTLTILDHLNQRLDDIQKVQDTKAIKTLDLTIKMWDRIPQKDIFQGNYSTCCIAMGDGNGSAMPHYILNTAYNMIEIVDNQTGKTIGNALCYFVEGENGKPAFIIDNIEIANSKKPSDETGVQLRNQIAEYAARVAKEVTKADGTPVYMSKAYNDVDVSDLKSKREKISFVGDTDCDEIYMDLYTGWTDKERFTDTRILLILRTGEEPVSTPVKNTTTAPTNAVPAFVKIKGTEKLTPVETAAINKNAAALSQNIETKAAESLNTVQNLFGLSKDKLVDGNLLMYRTKGEEGITKKYYRKVLKYDEMIEHVRTHELTPEEITEGKKPLTPEQKQAEIERLTAEKAKLINDMATAEDVLADAQGARIIMDDTSPAKIEELTQNIIAGINSGEIAEVIDFENYGKDGSSTYFTREQTERISQAAGGKNNKINPLPISKKSNYTTSQFVIRLKNGTYIEIQIRGRQINDLAEAEHILYKIREKEGGPADVEKAYTELDNNPELSKEYSKYISQWYDYSRRLEMGIAAEEPKLPEGVDKVLNMNYLLELVKTGQTY